MANGKGFADINPYANAAGVVLPESQTEDFAIDQIQKQGILRQKQAQANAAYKAQVNKDFATNKLAIPPTVTYQSELAGLSQKWYDKGVQYRRQNFDPFNPDYNKPDQVAASEQYLAEKRQIEEMAGTAKEVDKLYNDNKKAVQEGKLDGWDDFEGALKGQSLQQLYKNGGVQSLPMLYKPYDQKAVDEDTKIRPMVRTYKTPVPGAPGVFEDHEEKYVDMKSARNTAETTILAQGGALTKKLQREGIGDPNSLYTKGGHYITYDNPNDPEDPGKIDQPAMFHQMVIDHLTNPALIKQLPPAVKQRILDSHAPGLTLTDGSKLIAGKVVKPYDISKDPDFINYMKDRFGEQLQKEAGYQSLINNTVQRNLPADLGDKTKTDVTLARLKIAESANQISQAHLDIAKQANNRSQAKWNEHLKDASTREQWIKDIQNGDAKGMTDLQAAIGEVHGRFSPNPKGGINVEIPEYVPNPAGGKDKQMHVYHIDPKAGSAGRIVIEQILNKLPTFGKEKGLKTEPYSSAPLDQAGDSNDDDINNF